MIQNPSAQIPPENIQTQSKLIESRGPTSKSPKNKYLSVPATEEQLQKRSDYFSNLIAKNENFTQMVNNFIENKKDIFNMEILEGKYEIKKREWSAEEDQKKTIYDKTNKQPFKTKKQLENQLKNIEYQLEQEQEQDQPNSSRMLSEEERNSFLKKIQLEKKQLLRRKQQYAKQLQQQKSEAQKRLKQQRQRQQAERKNKKRKQLEEKMRMQQEEQRNRTQLHKQQTLLLKQKMKEKTMVDKIQEQFIIKQNQSLEEKKKRLAEIRMIHKPINRKELDEFAHKIDSFHKERLEAKTSQQKIVNKSLHAFYKSVFYKRVEKEIKIFQNSKGQDDLHKLKEARQKIKKFADHIRTDFRPSIDSKKVEELKFRNISMKNRSLSSAKAETPHKIGLRYLQFSKLQIDHQKLLVSSDQKTESQQQQKEKNYDYLAQMRKKNKNRSLTSAQDLLEQLQRRQLTKQQKAKKIFEFTSKLQKKAKLRQELDKIGTNNAVDDQLDALYLQAIQAKLSLLDD